jgi:trehalose 6-phosphate synthase
LSALLVQWAAPSRTAIAEYVAEREEIERVVQRINASNEHQPVRFEMATLAPEMVAAGLRDADVCLVTSLSDGMNLVAKEYVALQRPERPGVLILSDGCGAAERMDEALVVPAGDVDALEVAMERALAMPLEERRKRWEALSTEVETNTVHDWRRRYLEALAAATASRDARGSG